MVYSGAAETRYGNREAIQGVLKNKNNGRTPSYHCGQLKLKPAEKLQEML